MKFLVLFFLSFHIIFSKGQIPQFENNYSKNDSINNKDLIHFSKKFDFVISHHNTGYWTGGNNYYHLLTLNKKGWQIWESRYKKEKIRFYKIKKQQSQIDNMSLYNFFDKNKIWDIDNVELNRYKKSYFITDEGDTIIKKRTIVADGSYHVYNFITKNNAKTVGLYSSDINNEQSIIFERCNNFFQKWWYKIIELNL